MQTAPVDDNAALEPSPADAAVLPPQLSDVAALRGLHDSYRRLLERIATVERELSRANVALREKVAALDLARRNLDAVLDAIPSGVVVVDRDGIVTRVNAQAEVSLGARADALVGKAASGIKSPRGTPLLEGSAREIVAEGIDGRTRVFGRSRAAVKDETGSVSATVVLIDDRTERRRLEERLKHHETLAAIGEMSATVAHEIRNPLHGIEGFANLLLRALPDVPENRKSRTYAENIVKGVCDLNGTISNLLDFARRDRFHPVRRDLVQTVLRARDLALLGADAARFSVDLQSPDSVMAVFDEALLMQAVRNLIANAIDAMPGGGRVRVNIVPESSAVAIRVEDDGPGVRPELRQRVFAPFFTTKSRGTGLGLAIVAKAASAHGGHVSVLPSEKGAVFNLWIPNVNHQQEL